MSPLRPVFATAGLLCDVLCATICHHRTAVHSICTPPFIPHGTQSASPMFLTLPTVPLSCCAVLCALAASRPLCLMWLKRTDAAFCFSVSTRQTHKASEGTTEPLNPCYCHLLPYAPPQQPSAEGHLILLRTPLSINFADVRLQYPPLMDVQLNGTRRRSPFVWK